MYTTRHEHNEFHHPYSPTARWEMRQHTPDRRLLSDSGAPEEGTILFSDMYDRTTWGSQHLLGHFSNTPDVLPEGIWDLHATSAGERAYMDTASDIDQASHEIEEQQPHIVRLLLDNDRASVKSGMVWNRFVGSLLAADRIIQFWSEESPRPCGLQDCPHENISAFRHLKTPIIPLYSVLATINDGLIDQGQHWFSNLVAQHAIGARNYLSDSEIEFFGWDQTGDTDQELLKEPNFAVGRTLPGQYATIFADCYTLVHPTARPHQVIK